MQLNLISIVITTYNWTKALHAVLQALTQQTYLKFEVIIADDGSTEKTKQLIQHILPKLPYKLKHVWQSDKGFRAAKIRNKAIAKAQGDYIIFLDGDCIPPLYFIERHCQLAELGWFVTGNRVLLSPSYTKKILTNNIDLNKKLFLQWIVTRLQGKINRFLPLLHLPIKRKITPNKWKGVKTCNLGVWRQDLININGLDEAFIGWGYEDSDLVIRLIHQGCRGKNGRFAIPVFHLWHSGQDRSDINSNLQRLNMVIESDKIKAELGLSKYLENQPNHVQN